MKKGTAIGIGCGVLAVIGLGCLGLLGLGGWWGVQQIKAMDEAAESFLAQLGAGDVDGAYQAATESLRRQQTPEQFTTAVQKIGLTDWQSASWTNRKVTNDQGLMEGTVATRSGGSIPVTVTLVRQGGTWRVSSLSSPASGVTATSGASPAGPPLPSEDEAVALAKRSLLDIGTAVRTGDCAALHKTISKKWQEQISPGQLAEALRDLVDKKADLGSEATVRPQLDKPPAFNEDGLLVVEGHYPLPERLVAFRLKYFHEGPAWKLFGMNVKVDKRAEEASRQETPSEVVNGPLAVAHSTTASPLG